MVPVLVRGAKMPRAEQLSSDLEELAYRNAVELTHARWKSDVQLLVRALRPYLEAAPLKAVAPIGPEPMATGLEATGLEAAALAGVSRELATYIGPVAEIVVKRAARRCPSMADLCVTVAQEIESTADRARFCSLAVLSAASPH